MEKRNLNITSVAIHNDVLQYDFGGGQEFGEISFPLKWDNVPEAKSYALYIIDYDATHVCGFPFIHWVVANISKNELGFDATHNLKGIIAQGQNSTSTVTYRNLHGKKPTQSELLKAAKYVAPTPPDGSHTYTIVLFALDVEKIDLKDGFFLDQMLAKLHSHILVYDWYNFKYPSD